MNVFSVLLRPMLSEKSVEAKENLGQYGFVVRLNSTKKEIAHAVQRLFNVEVKSVNTCVMRGKQKRRGMHVSLSPKFKKAYVSLKKGQTIKEFDEQ